MLTRVSWLIPAAVLFSGQAAHTQQACENLVNVKLPYTLITAATSVPEGAAPAPGALGAPPAGPGAVPAHCDVRGVIRPSADSHVKFALWLPAMSAWNAKYRQEGNGGSEPVEMSAALRPWTRAPNAPRPHFHKPPREGIGERSFRIRT